MARVEKAAEEGATKKAYCDKELAKIEAKKVELDDDVEALTTKIDWCLDSHDSAIRLVHDPAAIQRIRRQHLSSHTVARVLSTRFQP